MSALPWKHVRRGRVFTYSPEAWGADTAHGNYVVLVTQWPERPPQVELGVEVVDSALAPAYRLSFRCVDWVRRAKGWMDVLPQDLGLFATAGQAMGAAQRHHAKRAAGREAAAQRRGGRRVTRSKPKTARRQCAATRRPTGNSVQAEDGQEAAMTLLQLEVTVLFRSLCPPIDWEEAIYQHLLTRKLLWRKHGLDWHEQNKERGLCARGCRRAREPGYTSCSVCREELRSARKERYLRETADAEGRRRCGQCGNKGHDRRTCARRQELS
jgi:hypothetical protein